MNKNSRFCILGTYSKNYKNRIKIYHWYWQAMKKSWKLNFYIVHICHMYGRWEVYISARFYFSALIILAPRCIGKIKLNKCTKVNSKRKYSKEHLSGALFFGTDFNSPLVGIVTFWGNGYIVMLLYMATDTEATKMWRSLPDKKVIINNGPCASVINGQQ